MRMRFRLVILWLAAAFVLAGSAYGFAQSGSNHGSDVSAVAKPTATPPGPDHGEDVSEVAKKAAEGEDESDSEGTHPDNHGRLVSSAAHCEDVDDPATAASPDFTAPADCEDSGRAHGRYVRSVARSDAGKSNTGNGPAD